MTAYVPFNPSSSGVPWTGQFTLDGNAYKAQAAWNIAGQRWYLSLSDSSGNLVWYGPLIGSPLNYDIYLAYSLFTTSTLVFRADTGNFEVNP